MLTELTAKGEGRGGGGWRGEREIIIMSQYGHYILFYNAEQKDDEWIMSYGTLKFLSSRAAA